MLQHMKNFNTNFGEDEERGKNVRKSFNSKG